MNSEHAGAMGFFLEWSPTELYTLISGHRSTTHVRVFGVRDGRILDVTRDVAKLLRCAWTPEKGLIRKGYGLEVVSHVSRVLHADEYRIAWREL